MFKRLREGLFGRTEGEQAPAEAEAPDDQLLPVTDAATDQATADGQDPDRGQTAEESFVVVADVATAAPTTATTPSPAPARGAPQPAAYVPLVSTAAPAEPTAVEEAVADGADLDDLTAEDAEERRGGRFRNPFRISLGRTRALFGRVSEAMDEADEITDDIWDELEEALISGDVGVQTTERLLATLRDRVRAEQMMRGSQLREALKEELELLLGAPEPLVFSDTTPITVILVVGVNGVGKTTSIAKMANLLKRQKHRVMLAAGDTFRAAATEQLKLWGDRVGVPVISHQHGADPGAVVYDAMQAAQARNTDVLIVDTAGRLHTKFNLMQELKKIVSVLQRYDPEAPHEVLLVIDATTGQNGFLQAKQFVQDSGVSGVILTKLDGTARGGITFAIAAELGLPIKFIGTGEGVKDLAAFDAREFVEALFDAA